MVMSYKAGPELGLIEVHTTENRGHPVEFWAERCVDRIIGVSNEAPEQVQFQVKEFKDTVNHSVDVIHDRITKYVKKMDDQIEKIKEVTEKTKACKWADIPVPENFGKKEKTSKSFIGGIVAGTTIIIIGIIKFAKYIPILNKFIAKTP